MVRCDWIIYCCACVCVLCAITEIDWFVELSNNYVIIL